MDIFQAIEKGFLDIVKELLDSGEDVNLILNIIEE